MKKKYFTFLFVIVLFLFNGCKKEDKVLKKLVGTWEITEFKRAGGYVKSDFSTSKTTIEFIKYKKAYTATLKGIYKVDYTNPSITDVVDTFRYQLKGTEIDITSTQKNTKLIKNRFKISNYKSSNIKLTRTDSTDLYINITK